MMDSVFVVCLFVCLVVLEETANDELVCLLFEFFRLSVKLADPIRKKLTH